MAGRLKNGKRPASCKTDQLPYQDHHFGTNKNSQYTPQMQNVIDEYGLDLDDAWNREYLPHLGRHPNEYHDFVLRQLKRARNEAGNDQAEFLELFEEYVKEPVRNNPEMLRADYWR